MSRISLWKQMITIFFIAACLFTAFSSTAYGAVQNFSGNFSEDTSRYVNWSVDIPFTIPEHSETDFEFDSLCEDDVYFYLIIAENKPIAYVDIISHHIVKEKGPDKFVNNIPLSQGDYIARMFCARDVLTSYPDPEWNLKVTSSPISITGYAPDQEPPSEEPVNVYSTKSFTGWMGLWGTAGLRSDSSYTRNGRDNDDRFIARMKKGDKLKFKIEWGEFRTSTDEAIRFHIYIQYYQDGKTYLFHSGFQNITNNGYVTEEFTLPWDPELYEIRVGAFSPEDDVERYGGYKLTLIINGEPEPEPKPGELLVTIQEAAWRKKLLNGQTVYVLNIDYEVENTHNVTKTLESFASVHAPLAKNVPGETRYSDRSKLIKSILDTRPCQFDEIKWDQFCTGRSLNDGICRYYATSTGGPIGGRPISISAHSKKNFTELFPVSTTHYNSFDNSLQFIAVALTDESGVQRYDCDTNGLSFWPFWSMVPMLQPLLLGK